MYMYIYMQCDYAAHCVLMLLLNSPLMANANSVLSVLSLMSGSVLLPVLAHCMSPGMACHQMSHSVHAVTRLLMQTCSYLQTMLIQVYVFT